MSDDSSKVIIDEDWKAQVEREKREAAEKAPEAEAGQVPPAPEEVSFSAVVSMLSMQTMMALGMLAQQQDQEEIAVDLNGAKYMIDMLMVLRDKTKGNLDPKEKGYLTQALSDLQQAFVVRSQQVQENAMRGAGIDPHAGLGPEA
ncbi:MAG: DUF1844 domain-containing protein [Nitrospiraceae bacterium]|nr:DUF1844 domain-containing protein [Nitrospiraceae bacterium]